MNSGYSPQLHWGNVWNGRDPTETSWYEPTPDASLALIDAAGTPKDGAILDVGGGASTLVDHLLDAGYENVTVLDIAQESLQRAQDRLGDAASTVTWRVGDITRVDLDAPVDLWHDRAVFHFLTDPGDRAAYRRQIERAVPVGGHAIVATFAPDGPTMCSGLPVQRYDPEALSAELGGSFTLVEARRKTHETPWGAEQRFQYALFERI